MIILEVDCESVNSDSDPPTRAASNELNKPRKCHVLIITTI